MLDLRTMDTPAFTPEEAFEEAVRLASPAPGKPGTRRELAKRIGVKPQAISQWDIVPVGRVLAVEAATGVSRHLLRPDFYPPEVPAHHPNADLAEARV
jgi:hypothetical protein